MRGRRWPVGVSTQQSGGVCNHRDLLYISCKLVSSDPNHSHLPREPRQFALCGVFFWLNT